MLTRVFGVVQLWSLAAYIPGTVNTVGVYHQEHMPHPIIHAHTITKIETEMEEFDKYQGMYCDSSE